MDKLKVQTNIDFKDVTTFHIGGKIKYFFETKSKNEICEAVTFARENNLSIFIIGGGSDILASDKDFNGVVIRYVGNKIKYLGGGRINSEAGVIWDDLVRFSVEKNLQGIECLSGIPGTVGASPIQNIGAYGQELKNTFINLTAFDIDKNKFVEFNNNDCEFGYRESIFKKTDYWQKFIITDITLKLTEGGKTDTIYQSLEKYFGSKGIVNPSLKEVRDAVLATRSKIFQDPKIVGNAGSFFKNPIVTASQLDALKNKYNDIKYYQSGDKFKIPAGWILEKSGWKGKAYKEAGVSPNHALIIINRNNKSPAKDVLDLANKIILDVNKKFGIELEKEVQLINF